VTVEYSIVARGNPQDPAEPKRYYPMLKSTGELTLRDLAERAAEMSTLSPVDVAAAVEAFLTIVPRALADGNIVRLGDFGTFSLRVRATGADTEEAVAAQNITRVIASFRPGKRFRDALDPDVIAFKKA
jgi:predicted histone-like DNA-binding protein